MKNNSKRFSDENEINITPMMDVVFIMLIFFIVSTSFVKEKGIGISQPSVKTSHNDESNTATIKLDISGYTINGQTVALDSIASRLSQLKAVSPELQAQLFSAQDIKIETLVRAMEQVKAVDITLFSVGAY